MTDNDVIIKVTDPRGYTVSLTKERYYDHILRDSNHTKIEIADISNAISNPNYIYRSTRPNTIEYYRSGSVHYPTLFTHVSVAEYDDSGDVRTAYHTKKIAENSIVSFEKGGCLYVNINNKL